MNYYGMIIASGGVMIGEVSTEWEKMFDKCAENKKKDNQPQLSVEGRRIMQLAGMNRIVPVKWLVEKEFKAEVKHAD